MPVVGASITSALLLPGGGSVGDVLTKQSATNSDVAWLPRTTGSGASPMYVSGSWYSNLTNTTSSTAVQSSALPGGYVLYQPLWLPKPVSISAMAIYASVTANTPIVLGAQSMGAASRQPSEYVFALGVYSPPSATAAMQVVPMQQITVLPQGWSFLTAGWGAATTVTLYGASTTSWAYRMYREQCTNVGPNSAPNTNSTTNYVYTATSADGTPVPSATVTNQYTVNYPAFTVWFKVA